MRRLTAARLLGGWSALVVLVAIVFSIGSPLFGKAAFHASDVLQVVSPWRDDAPPDYRPQIGVVTDTVDAVLPARAAFRDGVHDGEFPLWMSEPAGGSWLGSNPNAATLSPFTLPYLVVPLWYAPGLVKLLEMLTAVGFTFLFLRRLGLGRPAALTAGLIFAFSGFQVVWTNWPQTLVAALIPALFWAVERGVAMRRTVTWWPAAVVSAIMWLTGFPAVTLWAHIAAGVYGLVRLVAVGWRPSTGPGEPESCEPEPGEPPPPAAMRLAAPVQKVAALAGVFALGLAIAAVQLLPFALRLANLPLEYRVEKDVGALPWESLVTLAAPFAYGSAVHPGLAYFGPVHIVEMQSFIGVTALLLVVAGAVAGRGARLPVGTRSYLWVTTAVCGVLIYVGGPLLQLHQAIPVIGSNQIGRLRSLLGFLLAVLAGLGLQAIADRRLDRRRGLVIGSFAGLAVAFVFLARPAWAAAVEADASAFVGRHLAWVAAAAVAGAAIILASILVRRGGLRTAGLGAIVLLIATESVALATPFWPRIPTELFYPETPAHEYLREHLGEDRLAAAGSAFYPGTAALYGFHSVTAHVLTPDPYAELLTAADPDAFARSRTFPHLSATSEVMTSPALDRMGATLFAAPIVEPIVGEVQGIVEESGLMRLGAGRTHEAEIPPGEVRALRLRLRERSSERVPTWIEVEIRDSSGEIVADGRRRVHERDRLGDYDIGVLPRTDWSDAADDDGPWTVTVRIDAVAGWIGLGTGPETFALARVTPDDDSLRLVYTRGVNIYERLDALPRIRWAGRAEVVTDPTARVDALARGVPAGTVVLSHPDPREPADGDAARDEPGAAIEVLRGRGDTIVVRVETVAPGYLVLADSVQDGWRAEINGQAVDLLEADHAFGAVAVPAGSHEVRFVYAPPGLRLGAGVSLLAIVVLAGLAYRARRPRMTQEF